MPSTIYALVDCNNFYVSCERVFNPKLLKKPVIVLSNNDGCAISRSNEAKALGIPMGAPLFKIKDAVRKHNMAVLSSNFNLYGDISTRVMSIINQYVPEMEIYSIDEAFLNLTNMQSSLDLRIFCIELAKQIEQCTGIPVSIGIASTRTLAKIANQLAKKQDATNKIFYLDSPQQIFNTLANYQVGDIWGVGGKTKQKLQAMGVNTAAQLAYMEEKIVKASFNIVMWRTVQELNGNDVIRLNNTKDKQHIRISRSFGYRLTELIDLQQALATYTSMACEKLRKQNSVAGGFYILLNTGLHGASETIYKNSAYINLEARTNDTRVILQAAKNGLKQIFKHGYRYKKVGIILCDLSSVDSMQFDLFGHTNIVKSDGIMTLVDQINHKLGRSTIQFAAAGLEKNWQMNAKHKSNNYTGAWQELPVVGLS